MTELDNGKTQLPEDKAPAPAPAATLLKFTVKDGRAETATISVASTGQRVDGVARLEFAVDANAESRLVLVLSRFDLDIEVPGVLKTIPTAGPTDQAKLVDLAGLVSGASRLLTVISALRHGDCWCEGGVGNPMMRGNHTAACIGAQTFLREFGRW